MNSSIVTVNEPSNTSLLSREVTWESNENFRDGIAISNKDYNNKRQQEKLKNQILYVKKSHHQKYQESRLQNENLNAATDSVTSLNNSNSHK